VILVVLFVLRGGLMFADSRLLKRRWMSMIPHINDTVLLVAALYMAWLVGFQDWVVAKLVGLVLYIVLAIVALKRGPSKSIRGIAFVAALLVLGYVAAVGVTKQVVPG
jgi:uncharacterized membrane protein SirB2